MRRRLFLTLLVLGFLAMAYVLGTRFIPSETPPSAALRGVEAGDPAEASSPIRPSSSSIPDSFEPPCDAQPGIQQLYSRDPHKPLQISISDSRGWATTLLEAMISETPNIQDSSKETFSAQIAIPLENGTVCQDTAQVRITGDWKDHLDFANGAPIASMKVELDNQSLGQIVDFKLLLPVTRNGASEVVAATLFRELGFVAPRSEMAQVEVNGIEYQAILQEDLAKELLETSQVRETAILEIDEAKHWRNVAEGKPSRSTDFFPRITNTSWLRKGPTNLAIGLDAMDVLSVATQETWKYDLEAQFSNALLSGGHTASAAELARFQLLAVAIGGQHTLNVINRRFYYDPLVKALRPIYYDGNTRSLDEADPQLEYRPEGPDLREVTSTDFFELRKSLASLDKLQLRRTLAKAGVPMTDVQVNVLIAKIEQNLDELAASIPSPQSDPTSKGEEGSPIDAFSEQLVYRWNHGGFDICQNLATECEDLRPRDDELIDLLRGRLRSQTSSVAYAGSPASGEDTNTTGPPPLQPVTLVDDGIVLLSQGIRMNLDKDARKVRIRQEQGGERVAFVGGSYDDWTIEFEGIETESPSAPGSRFDQNLLTGCITFVEVDFVDTDISSNGGDCEDGVNFIRASGSVKDLVVTNTPFDAIDIDFSDLAISAITSKNSGNDCFDASAGDYWIGVAQVSQCGDKGFSIGEASTMTAQEVVIDKASIGIAVKDSSQVSIERLLVSDAPICASAYRKKQEFGGSHLQVEEMKCSGGKVTQQAGSRIEVP